MSNELKALIEETFTEINNDQSKDRGESHLNQKKASIYLQISQTTIIEWKKRGLILYHQILNKRKIYYFKSELSEAPKNIVRSKQSAVGMIIYQLLVDPRGQISNSFIVDFQDIFSVFKCGFKILQL